MVIEHFSLALTAEAPQVEISSWGMVKAYTTTLPLKVFTQKNCSRLYSIEIEFYLKKRQIRFLSHFFPDLGVCSMHLSVARWKARGRILFLIIEHFFANFYGWDVISGNLSKLAFFSKGDGSFWAHILGGRGRRLPTSVMWYENIDSTFFCFVTKHACDREMDGQTKIRQLYRTSMRCLCCAVKIDRVYGVLYTMIYHRGLHGPVMLIQHTSLTLAR